MNRLILSGVFIYMVMMLLVGYWSSKKIKNIEDFLIAGRRLPFYLAVATLIATWFGACTCIGSAGTAYQKGFIGVISDPFAAALSLILAGLFYTHLLRRLRLITITDVFSKYYSKNSGIFASLLMIPVYIGWLGSQMVAIGFIFERITGLPSTLCIIIGTAIVLIYTYSGGMWAVTLTDFIQILIIIVGLFTMLPIVLNKIGGFNVILERTPKEFWRFTPLNPTLKDWISYAGQWALMGLGCIVGQDLIQRSLASKNEGVARWSAVTAGIIYVVIGMVPLILAFIGRITMPGLENPELVIPNLAIEHLNPFMTMIFVSAVLAAIMSSADSSLLAGVSLATNNVILKIFPHIKEHAFTNLARMMTVIFTVSSMFIALWVNQIYNLMVNSWATLLVAIFVPVTAALYWKKANVHAAWASMILGTTVWLGYIFFRLGTFQIEERSMPIFYTAAMYGFLVSLSSYILATLVRYKKIIPIKLPSEYPKD